MLCLVYDGEYILFAYLVGEDKLFKVGYQSAPPRGLGRRGGEGVAGSALDGVEVVEVVTHGGLHGLPQQRHQSIVSCPAQSGVVVPGQSPPIGLLDE